MGEPVNPTADFLLTRGCLRTVQIAIYDVATDTWGSSANYQGTRSEKVTVQQGEDEGEDFITTTRWWIVGLPSRPPVRSHIIDGSDTWIIYPTETPDPLDAIYIFDCVLA